MSEQFDTTMESQEMIYPDSMDFEKNTEIKDGKSAQISEYSIKGYQFLKQNEIEKAIESFKNILLLDENNNYALVGLGDSERKRNNFTMAINYYTECLKFHPGNNYALFGLADCYKALNQFHKAIDLWEQYLTHDDRNITVLTRVADAYRKIHDFKQSKDLYLRVLDIEQNNAYALIGLGHLYYDFKEYRDALYYWTKMYDTNKENLDIRILTSIGNCHRKLRTFDKGVTYFEHALQMDPKNFYALFGLADCYRGMNQQYRSIEYWNKILDIDPQNKVILTRIGDAYRNTGDYNSARDYYNRALDIDFDVYAALGLALICKGEGKYEEASEKLSRLISNDPKNYRLYIDLADCYIKTNNKQKAIETLESFQKLGIRNNAINEMLDKFKNNRPLFD